MSLGSRPRTASSYPCLPWRYNRGYGDTAYRERTRGTGRQPFHYYPTLEHWSGTAEWLVVVSRTTSALRGHLEVSRSSGDPLAAPRYTLCSRKKDPSSGVAHGRRPGTIAPGDANVVTPLRRTTASAAHFGYEWNGGRPVSLVLSLYIRMSPCYIARGPWRWSTACKSLAGPRLIKAAAKSTAVKVK